eukprot:1175387-Prorocentrum_minimum.AAC.2
MILQEHSWAEIPPPVNLLVFPVLGLRNLVTKKVGYMKTVSKSMSEAKKQLPSSGTIPVTDPYLPPSADDLELHSAAHRRRESKSTVGVRAGAPLASPEKQARLNATPGDVWRKLKQQKSKQFGKTNTLSTYPTMMR